MALYVYCHYIYHMQGCCRSLEGVVGSDASWMRFDFIWEAVYLIPKGPRNKLLLIQLPLTPVWCETQNLIMEMIENRE